MYPVSEAFLSAVQENTRKYEWTGKIVIEQQISVLELQDAVVTVKDYSEDINFTFWTDMENALGDSVGRYTLASTVTLLHLYRRCCK